MRTITTSNNLTIKAMDMITNKLKNIVVMCKIFFFKFRFGFGSVFEKKNLDSVRNEFVSVLF